ncbi:hypothetical protein AAG906_021791 [Vitis piasezkii]
MMFKDTSQDREAQPSMSLNKIWLVGLKRWNKKQSDSEGIMRWDQFKMSTLDATRAELALVILYLNKAEARDKTRYAGDGQPGTAQNVDKSTSLARKVFHLFFNNLLVLFVFLNIVFVALQKCVIIHFLDCNPTLPQFCNGHGTSDDVKEKKPDPSIYQTTVKRLGVSEKDCLVVEDSVTGLQVDFVSVRLLVNLYTWIKEMFMFCLLAKAICGILWENLGITLGATKDDQGKEVLDISEKGVVGFVIDLSAWCFSCNAYLDAQAILATPPAYETTYILKFGQASISNHIL